MENKSSLEIVEICLWENGGIILAAGCGTDQHSEGCCQLKTRGSQPNSVPWKNGIGVSCAGTAAPGKASIPGGTGEIWGTGYGMPALIHLVPSAQRPAALQDELISIKSKPFPKSTCEGFSGCSCLISLPHSRSTGTVSVLSLSRACLAGSGNEKRGGGGGGSRVCFVRQ